MTTFEFQATLLSNGQIAVPSDVALQIPAGEQIHVVLSWEAPAERDSIHTLGQTLLEKSYASADSVYDSLA